MVLRGGSVGSGLFSVVLLVDVAMVVSKVVVVGVVVIVIVVMMVSVVMAVVMFGGCGGRSYYSKSLI